MPLMRTLKAIVVLVALMIGLPAVSFAHEGHAHVSVGVSATPPAYLTGDTKSEFRTSINLKAHLIAAAKTPSSSEAALQAPAYGQKLILCTPGSCCCQGASSYGSGHCCSFGMTTALDRGVNVRKEKSFRLDLLGWPYPDLIFGFDRPPKV